MYLTPNDPGAFQDMVKLSPKPEYNYVYECPQCKGHGGWNLTLDAYKNGLTPEQRHFRACCSTCYGWGYTDNPTQCVHQWEWEKNTGKCLNLYRCTVCGGTAEWDSSD